MSIAIDGDTGYVVSGRFKGMRVNIEQPLASPPRWRVGRVAALLGAGFVLGACSRLAADACALLWLT